MKKTVLSYTHALLTILLAVFFIYAGVNKFIPKDRPSNPKANKAYIESIEKNSFENPISFRLAVKMLSASGFLKLVGVIQILAGLLMVIPRTRLVGLVFLLPITLNIFTFHFFMNNEMEENLKSGLFLFINLILIILYYKKLATLFKAKVAIE
ncbi:MAG: hypothetical protein WEA99_13395 [Brumimicrobium sp.]